MFGLAISRCLAIRKATCLVRKMSTQGLSTDVREAIQTVATRKGFRNYALETKPISAIGENSYGLVLQTKISCKHDSKEPFSCVIKIAPTNVARRRHMKVAQYYQREVFMYEHVLKAFRGVQQDEKIPREHFFDSVPEMYCSSLRTMEEFIIFEDLIERGFVKNSRKNLPTFEMTTTTLKALARYHAMSFVMQAKRPAEFAKLVDEIRFKDNLYTQNMDQVTIEFAKKYVCRTQAMIADDTDRPDQAQLSEVVQIFDDKFKEIALKAVNGGECAPYSVICHGDFWNNNILYRHDESNIPTSAMLIDFQMSRYASPVLDIVHYLFACTEKELRDAHFNAFIQSYYEALSEHLKLFDLDPEKIYPRNVLDSHLKTYGPYGFCMAIFAIPFFISDSSDIPDLDVVSEAINDLSDCEEKKTSEGSCRSAELIKRTKNLVNEYELMNENTIQVFKRRITGVVQDLIKYDMARELIEFSKQLDEEKSEQDKLNAKKLDQNF